MNISEPIWGPIIPEAASNDSGADPGISNMSVPNSFSETQSNAIITAISSSGPYLWSFKMYWTIASPVTFATILLPLIFGPILRSSVEFFYDNRSYARLFLMLLGLGAIAVLDELVPTLAYILIFGISFGLLALGSLIWVSVTGENQWIWAGFAAVFASSLALDELAVTFNKVGVTGYLPLTYLLAVWYRIEIRNFVAPKFRRTQDYIAKMCPWWLSPLFSKPLPWVICTYNGFAVLVYFVVPYYGALTIFSVPLGILAINRVIRSFVTQTDISLWILYVAIFTASLTIDAYFAWNSGCSNVGSLGELDNKCGDGPLLFGFTCFVPATYLFGLWLVQETELFVLLHGLPRLWWTARRRVRHPNTLESMS